MNKKVNLYRLFIIILLLLTFVSAFFISFFYNFDSNKYIKKMNARIEYTTNYKLVNKDKTTTFTSLNDLDKLSVLYNYSMILNIKSTIKDNYKIIGKLVISDGEKDLFIEELFNTDIIPTNVNGSVLNIKETKEINFSEDYLEYLKAIQNEYYKGKKARIDYVLVNDIKMYNNYLSKNITKNDDVIIDLGIDAEEQSKADWDSFEVSWDFKKHPLLRNVSTIYEAFTLWQSECEDRFNQLKTNEEELNRIFIDIYGLQDELTPEVEDKDVTVRKADLQRDIKSLLSYAVGCMFGRYSLDKPGLIFAGGNFDSVYWKYKGQAALDENDSPIEGGYAGISLAEYHYPKFHDTDDWETATWLSYEPDVDNVIPITDEEYLDDDIVSRLCAWLKAVYGADTLEENLDYIAKALGNKGSTSREIIRNYFLNDFFKDHCQTYSVTGSGKRPIYWLFDSGKQNGFKALVYLHRYTPDTIGNLRIDYLHKMQRVYESEINRMQDMMDHSENAREVAAASKRKDKLAKQLKECREYDEKISHLALSRIELDLDDGVKVNYRKLQTAQDGKFYEVLADSKNIMVKEKK